METVTYRTGVSEAFTVKTEIPLIKVSSKNYNDEVRPMISSCRRSLCMVMRETNVLRVLHHAGSVKDTPFPADAVRHICSAADRMNRKLSFYVVGGNELAILVPERQTTPDMSMTTVRGSYKEQVYASTPGEDGIIFVLGAQSVFEVREADGSIIKMLTLTPKTVVKHPAFGFHRTAQLLLVPAKNQHLDLISTRTARSVLTKVWEPHPEGVPTFAHFFTTHKFEEEDPESALLMTTARGNSELRFWSFNCSTQRFSLRQEITVANQDIAGDDFTLSVTPCEEYIVLASRKSAFAVVVEMHRSKLMAFRVTTWKIPAPALCCTAYVGKVAESAASKSVNYELFLTVRTADTFTQVILDSHKLVGGSNLATIQDRSSSYAAAVAGGGASSAPSAAAGGGASNSVANWFPGLSAGSNASAVAVTSVSSSLLGDKKSTSAIPASMAAKAIQLQTQKFCEQVHRLDQDFITAQKHATETMRVLQDPKFRDEAQSNGRRFAIRNRARLQQGAASGSGSAAGAGAPEREEPGMMSESQRELILSINSFVKEVEGGSEAAASAALKALLQKQLKGSVERASAEMRQLEVAGTVATNINNTEAARQFKIAVDNAARQMLESVREFLQMTRATLKTSSVETNEAVQRARDFVNSARDVTGQIQSELAEVKTTLASLQAAGGVAAAVAEDPNVLVARAIKKAEEGDWAGAFTIALESSDVSVLLAFLESQICEESEKTITDPATLSLPLFLSLCLQLTFCLEEQPGAVPLRVQQLHRFYVERDDSLRSMKRDSRLAGSFEVARRELSVVMSSLEVVDPSTLDRRTRNNFRLVTKLLSALLSDE